MSLINCNVELRRRLKKYCVLSVAGTDNANGNYDDNVVSNIKDTKNVSSCINFISKRQSKLLWKRFERSVYWNEYKTKSENKIKRNEFRYFHESNFVGINRLFSLFFWNENAVSKRFEAEWYLLPTKMNY